MYFLPHEVLHALPKTNSDIMSIQVMFKHSLTTSYYTTVNNSTDLTLGLKSAPVVLERWIQPVLQNTNKGDLAEQVFSNQDSS